MANESWLLCKSLAADVANIRSLAGVNQYVLLLRGLSRKSLAADWTGKWPDTLMDPQMKVQVPLLAESLAASRTDDLLLPFVPD